jgi:hypothetical protein
MDGRLLLCCIAWCTKKVHTVEFGDAKMQVTEHQSGMAAK